MKKPSQKAAKAKCDILFSQIVRSIGMCEFSGVSDNLQCAHIISRKFGNTRTDFQNAICLSASEHRKGHDNPMDFALKVTVWSEKNKVDLSKVRERAYSYKKMDWITRLQELKDIKQLIDKGALTLQELR